MTNSELEIALEKELESKGLWSSSVCIDDDEVVVYNVEGDWKHDHLRTDFVVENWLKSMGYFVGAKSSFATDDGDSDYYTANHYFHVIKLCMD